MSFWKMPVIRLGLIGLVLWTPLAHAESLTTSLEAALSSYIRRMNIDPESPSVRALGFSAERAEEKISADIFHAFSPMDITVKSYECSSEARCKLVAENPRCFYFAQGGRFSLRQLGQAYQQGLGDLTRTDTLQKIKFWQSADKIYGRMIFTNSENKREEKNSVCTDTSTDTSTDTFTELSCEATSPENLQNEP